MVDMFTKEKRSEIMSKIKSKETAVEIKVFRYLTSKKIYFKKHYSKAKGKPDIALPRKKKAVFIDGDFWHGYKYKVLKERLPKKYWVDKIEKNIKRDNFSRRQLRRDGWKVLRIWEHELKAAKFPKGVKKIEKFLNEKPSK